MPIKKGTYIFNSLGLCDKLDGKVSAAYYDKKQREWRRQMEKISSKIVQHGHANEGYLEEGVNLLELVLEGWSAAP